MRKNLRLETRTKRIEDIVSMVTEGRVRIPDFQRRIKWRHADVRTLFDSVYRGYPIGTLLMWQRRAEHNPDLHVGPVKIDAPEMEEALWVVDGQQRLTSLVGALRHPHQDPQEGDLFNVWFDLETEVFFHPRRHQSTRLAVPMSRVLDAPTFQDWLFEFVDETQRRELVGVANHLGAQIRDYWVPLYTVDTDDPQVARDIFLRTNRTGRRMEMHEVFAAMAKPGSAAPRPEQIAERLSKTYGAVNPNNVFKTATALGGDSVTHGPKLETENTDRAALMGDTERALDAAYRYLADEVIHTRLLPARVTPVVTLARFFHRFPDPNLRSRRLLRRWLWRGFFSGTLESDARTLRRSVTAVHTDEEQSVQRLLSGVKEERRPITDRVDGRDGWTRLAFLVLAHQRPLFPDGDGDVDSDVFEWLRAGAGRAFVRWPSAPNVPWARFLVPASRPGDLKQQVLLWAADHEAYRVELGSHLIGEEAARVLIGGAEDTFLSLRRAALEAAAEDLHDARGEPTASDRPALREV